MTDPNAAPITSVSADLEPLHLSVPRRAILGLRWGALLGGLLSLAGAVIHAGGMRRVMLGYLVAFAFVLSLSLGSIFFVLLQHLMRAGWGVVVRRPAEILGMNMISVALLFLPIAASVLIGGGQPYPWAQRDEMVVGQAETVMFKSDEHLATAVAPSSVPGHSHELKSSLYAHQTVDELTRSKRGWLNPTSYVGRSTLFLAIWIGIAWFYFDRSRHQDRAAGVDDTCRMEWWAGICTFAFGITLTYASFDLLMSLDPHWYSTIFGVYFFAGCAVGGFSTILLSGLLLERFGVTKLLWSDEHRRDLGRLLFAFVFFWGYIAFSQYMLLWYANVPETTRWFVVRGASTAEGFANSWGYLLVFLLFGHFIVPFLGLMSRHVKSNQRAMVFWTGWLLVMHYFDLYWLVMPELGSHFTLGLPEISTLLFVGCVYLLGASQIATRTSLIPIGDPRLAASRGITDAY